MKEIIRVRSEASLYGPHFGYFGRTGTSTATQGLSHYRSSARQFETGSLVDYSASPSQERALHRVSCPADWRGFAFLSGRNSLFDLTPHPSPEPYREAEQIPKTEPVSPMGDQPEVPGIEAGEEGAANNQNDHIPEDEVEGRNMAAQAVQGGQLSSIILFTGTKGLEALTYAETIDGSLAQLGWTQAQAAQAAISRGGNAVANWIRGERAAGITYNSWTEVANGQRPLRPAFIARFGPVYTTSGAVSAIADLKQRNSENAAAFMDRVKIAVDMLNYNVPEAD